MKITVTTLTDFIFVLDVSEELELENFKAFCEIESGFPASEIVIAFNGMPLLDNRKTLKDHGIRDGDAVILQHMLSRSQTNFDQNPSGKLLVFTFQVFTGGFHFFLLLTKQKKSKNSGQFHMNL